MKTMRMFVRYNVPFADHLRKVRIMSVLCWRRFSLQRIDGRMNLPSVGSPHSVYIQQDALPRQTYRFPWVWSGHQTVLPKCALQERRVGCHICTTAHVIGLEMSPFRCRRLLISILYSLHSLTMPSIGRHKPCSRPLALQ